MDAHWKYYYQGPSNVIHDKKQFKFQTKLKWKNINEEKLKTKVTVNKIYIIKQNILTQNGII